jgi:DNA-binding NarL/FixJ family response regulator
MLVVPFGVERAGLRSIIESSSLHEVVAEACLGQTALEMAAETEPDIAVVDYTIPDTTGLVLSHMLTRDDPHMSILLYCNATTEELIIQALRVGVRAFVLKSEAARHLVPALDALSDHRPYWDDAVDEEVFTRLMGGPPRPPDDLSRREAQVMHLVAKGYSTKDISGVLKIGAKAVENCRMSLRRKLRLRTAADMARYAIEHGIIDA